MRILTVIINNSNFSGRIRWRSIGEGLFRDATANVKINGSSSLIFAIERDVRQGCPLAPYLFLVVAEVLNAMVKRGMELGHVKGVKLPGDREQITAQYADDTSFTLAGEEGTGPKPDPNS